MTVSVFGLGYVGCVNIACLAKSGWDVIGVDVKREKVDQIASGMGTIVEKDVEKLLSQNLKRIRATTEPDFAVANSEISLVCVGTPPGEDGELNLSYVWRVAEQIGNALKMSGAYHVIALRSTVKPGTCRQFAEIVKECSGKIEGHDFDVVYHPEFLREGSAVADYFDPGMIVIGANQDQQKAFEAISSLYKGIQIAIKRVKIETAEIIKYINNSWHALKVVFANECSSICRNLGIDAYEVMQLFQNDRKLNISPAYLKPGFAYGGYCLPKDLQGLISMGKKFQLEIPVLSSVERSNQVHIENIGKWICSFGKSKVMILGVSFKEGTDDVRLSPKIDLVHYLVSSGLDVYIYDIHVFASIKNNINRKYILSELGALADCLVSDPAEVLEAVEVIVLANNEPEYLKIAEENLPGKTVLELGRTSIKGAEGYAWNQQAALPLGIP